MRKLKFKINAQVIEKEGDFSDLVPGTSGYLFATFEFSKEWDDCLKVASFFDRKGVEYAMMLKGDLCMIPDKVLADRFFKVQVVGQKRDYKILTNKLKVIQGG